MGKKMISKKIVSAVCILLLVLSQTGGALAKIEPYTDITPSHWAYYNILDLAEKGILKGYQGTAFQPERIVTYGEFVKMAVIADTGTDPGNASGKNINWASNYYAAALTNGYFNEREIPKSLLSLSIPRDKVALIVSSIVGDTEIPFPNMLLSDFTDLNQSTEYVNEILTAYAAGVVGGFSDGTFRPEDSLTRAEAAVIIDRLAEVSLRLFPSE